MPDYDYILVDASDNEELDRYPAHGSTDQLRTVMRCALLDAHIRTGSDRQIKDDGTLNEMVMQLSTAGDGRGVTLRGPEGSYRVIARRVG
jgi:hypothetical protein